MALVVEDGTGLSTAESYLSVSDLSDRVVRLGLGYIFDVDAAPEDAVEAALRRVTILLDGLYGERFVGRRRRIDQALEWPRSDAYPSGEGIGAILPPVGALAQLHGYYSLGGGARGRLAGYVGTSPRPTAVLPATGLPRALQDAVAQAAVRELAAPGSLAADSDPGVVTEETVGPISVKYSGARSSGGGVPPVVETTLRSIINRGSISTTIMRS